MNGITIERNRNGKPAFARIDLKKHGENLKDFFRKNDVELDEKEEFLPIEDFRKLAMEDVTEFCRKYGIR